MLKSTAVVALIAAAAASVQADTLTATFTCTTNPGGQIQGVAYGNPYNEWGTVINGLRSDLPAGAGVNADIPVTFPTFCVEIGENVNVGFGPAGTPGPTSYTFNVSPLAGSTTVAGGVFFDAVRTARMEQLWGSFYNDAAMQSTLPLQQIFQICVWEIAFDNDMNLATGNNVVLSTADPSVLPTAQAWLNIVAIGGGPSQPLYLLSGQGVQDLITPVPTPGAAALVGLGGIAIMRRRR